jgi:hypothetical protein
MPVSSEPRFVDTTLRYFTPPADGSKAWSHINADPTTAECLSNWEYKIHAVQVENLRGLAKAATLDKNGFQFFHHLAKHTSFANDEEIMREYYPESIELLKQLTGASHVVLFDHSEFCPKNMWTPSNGVRPVSLCLHSHPPQAPKSHQGHASESAARLKRARRPDDRIGRRARAAPPPARGRGRIAAAALPDHQSLATDPPRRARLATRTVDFNSVDRSRDLVPNTLKYPDRDGETYGVQWNENHRWKYVRGMTPEEGVLIKW